ncbi:hypothetical protein BGZ47_001422 [Haplosporangium gracile]|nr:hypothetical protein BGZ47_001422 [Haplosporangium gracile]
MLKPLPAGGRGASGGLLLLHRRRQQHRRPPSSQRLLLTQEQESLHRTWNAVIQFSARHLFCPAHAHTQVQTATTTATTTYKPIATVSRIRGDGSGGGGRLHLSHHTTATARPINSLSLPGSNFTVSSRGAASFIPRKLSTAATIESSEDASFYSSGYDHQRLPQDTRLRREPNAAAVPSRSSGSGSVTPEGGAASHLAHRPTPISPKQDEKDVLTPPAESSPTQTHIKSSSWHFPPKGSGSKFYNNDGNDPSPLEPVQSWASTANALSELYKSLRHLGSSSSKSTTTTGCSSSAAILYSALVNYNYLSRLQSLYDTILIPRRHTRALFLLQGREPKTRDNLEQLLRITTDLIWLNEKERQKKRRSASKLTSFGISTPAVSTTNSSDTSPHICNPADDYHGLRVSEYTILMNWIGSVTSTLGTQSSPATISTTNRSSTSSSTTIAATAARSMVPTPRYQHPIALSGPVDQAWAIWQDFLLTGMKPDIVLYTMLMDTLLKAKEFERADQIWNHMQSQGSSSAGGEGSSRDGSVTAGLGAMSSPRSSSSARSREHSEATSSSTHAVIPNLQTLSVMMQSHIQESDIDGVARTYKQLHHTTFHREQQRPINTVLVNQILKVLVDLGETKAAKAIFFEMQVDRCDIGVGSLGLDSSTEEDYTNNNSGAVTFPASATTTRPAVFSTPTHHQTSRRRASWKRDNRKHPSSSTSSTSDTSAAAGLSIRPNEATYRLMLQVARREKDSNLEDQILKELRSLPLPSSSPPSDPFK